MTAITPTHFIIIFCISGLFGHGTTTRTMLLGHPLLHKISDFHMPSTPIKFIYFTLFLSYFQMAIILKQSLSYIWITTSTTIYLIL